MDDSEIEKKVFSPEQLKHMRDKHLKILKHERNKLYYEKRKSEKQFCPCCYCYVDKYQMKSHLASKKHKARETLENKN